MKKDYWGKRTANVTPKRLAELLGMRMPNFNLWANRWNCSAGYLAHLWYEARKHETQQAARPPPTGHPTLAVLRRKKPPTEEEK